jgi:hypothetical protein
MRTTYHGLIGAVLGIAFIFATGFAMKSAKEKEIKIVSECNENPWINSEISDWEDKKVRTYLDPTLVSDRETEKNCPKVECDSCQWSLEKAEPKHALGTKENRLSRGDILPDHLYRRAKPLPLELTREMPAPPEGTKLVILDNKLVRVSSYSHTILDISDLPHPKS